SVKDLLEQSEEQLQAQPMEGKFKGDIIITPDCLNSIIDYYTRVFLRDGVLISGSSPFKDRLNERVAGDKFTLHSNPLSDEIADGYFITGDGYVAENLTIIDSGVLNSFLLSQYGANKTSLERAKNSGGAYIIEPGERPLTEIIKNIDRGILLARFSGGNPGPNGDFTGVAKNSFYIEEGEIRNPLTETMIAGNLADLFMSIKDISSERINFGSAVMPWICSAGVTISGK
ncbi:MAG: metallopeptidase TldD-related protein, partial [Halanaerobiales bacterium]